MRTHLPITVSASNPCPDRGCSTTRSASWLDRSSNTANTSSSRLPMYRLDEREMDVRPGRDVT